MEKRSRISNVENGWSGRHRADSRLFSLAAATRDLTSDKRSSVGPFTTRVQVSLFFRGRVKRWLKGNGRHQRGFGALGSPCGDSSRIGQPSSLSSSSVTWAVLSSGSNADTSGSQGVRRRWRGVGSKRKWCWWCLLGGFPASCQLKDTQLVFLASSDSYMFSSFPVGTAVGWNDGEWGQVGKIAEALPAVHTLCSGLGGSRSHCCHATGWWGASPCRRPRWIGTRRGRSIITSFKSWHCMTSLMSVSRTAASTLFSPIPVGTAIAFPLRSFSCPEEQHLHPPVSHLSNLGVNV